jgi:putative peptidoglycan lipid II flippase
VLRARAPVNGEPGGGFVPRAGGMMRVFLAPVASTGALTLLSRLLGFLRDALMANALGAGPVADAFVVAFRIPNLFRRLLAEGVLAQGLVPPLVQAASREGPPAARAVLRRWLLRAGLAGLLLLVTGPLLAPALVRVLAPGLDASAAAAGPAPDAPGELAPALLAAMWPYVAASGVAAVLAAGLNARGWFRAVACAPLMLNLAILAGFLLAPPDDAVATAHALARAVAMGALLQVLWLAAAAWRRHAAGEWSGRPAGPALTDSAQMPSSQRGGRGRFLVAVLNASVLQVNLLVATVVASTLLPGALAWLYFAERLVEFPLGIIAGALAAVLLPRLAAAEASGETRLWCASVDLALELSWLVLLPAAVGLSMLALPVVATLFQHGAMTRHDALQAALALAIFAPGVLPLGIARILLPAALTRVASRDLLLAAGVLPLAHLALVLTLTPALAHVGIALAASLTAVLQALLLLLLLAACGYVPLAGRRLAALGRPALATLGLGLLLWLFLPGDEQWLLAGTAWRSGTLLGIITASVAAYAVLLRLTGWHPARLLVHGHLIHGSGSEFRP